MPIRLPNPPPSAPVQQPAPVELPRWRTALGRLAAGLLLAVSVGTAAPIQEAPASITGAAGELGGDLAFLLGSYAPPRAGQESNYFFDLWAGRNFRRRVVSSGLTNNQALFVNSHGIALDSLRGKRYALFPHQSLLRKDQPVPYYSPADLARVMGPQAAARVHNIVIGGCNAAGAFDPGEFRQHFPNATNITHMAAGDLGCQPMLLQALMTNSENVQDIYESAIRHTGGQRFLTATTPTGRAARFRPYIAQLYLPNATVPFRIQKAGREILDPTRTPLPGLKTLLAEGLAPGDGK